MATKKVGGFNGAGNKLVRDSQNASQRFGFGGPRSSPLNSTPKFGDMFYVELHGINERTQSANKLPTARFAKSVSGVGIQTTTFPVDRYGKRVYVPTRIDFPEVQLQFYDTTDGQTFQLMREIYGQFFANADMNTDSASIEQELMAIGNQGRKLSAKGKSFHQSFEKVVIFHFFGNLDSSVGAAPGIENQGFGDGQIQKIEIINPIVSNITFSPSDYADSTLRTMDISLQPENVVISPSVTTVESFPDWMNYGNEYLLEAIQSSGTSGWKTDHASVWNDALNNLLKDFYGDKSKVTDKMSGLDIPGADDAPWATGNQTFSNSLRAQNTQINQQKLDELAKLNNKLAFSATTSPDADAAADLARQEIEEAKSRHQFLEAVPEEKFINPNPFEPATKYPQVADFANLGNTYDGGTQRYGGSNLASALKGELVNAFFNGRSINWNNIKNSAAQGIVGNTGIGTLQNLSKTKQSKFGIIGDLVRDGINNAGVARGGNANPTTTVSTNPNVSNSALNSAQSSITTLKNLTKGIR